MSMYSTEFPTSSLPLVAVSGNGVMGQLVHKALETEPTLSCIGCIEPKETSLSELSTVPSGIIDFSHPDCLTGIIEYVTAQYEAGYRIPVVIATTGFTEQQKDQIKELSCLVPVVFSSNFSIGVTLLHRVLREFSPLLIDWDKEIVEMHHNRKVDAPKESLHPSTAVGVQLHANPTKSVSTRFAVVPSVVTTM